jgi:uncharacterized protein YprB with RNaseH-like and TPR domain
LKILFMDTESTSLTAIMGRILCASFVSLEGKPYTFRSDLAPWKSKDVIDDSKLCVAIRDELEKANLIVGWNSKLHDIPLLNARLAKAGERPYHCQNFHLDAMWYAGGSSMKIGSRKLDNVAKFFSLSEQKTDITWDDWARAGSGDKKAMKMVVTHCEGDVKVLRETYHHLLPYVKNLHR